jgi:anti-sigma regulatory factor (Ser/Thr protein kinase)
VRIAVSAQPVTPRYRGFALVADRRAPRGMTVPSTSMLRGAPAAYSHPEPWLSVGLAVLPAPEQARGPDWPLSSYLELTARPESARSARLHARNALREWRLDALADTIELLVSELITNAVRASALVALTETEGGPAPRIRFWLSSDRDRVLIQVWDRDDHLPVRQDEELDAEAGRGLLLVDTLSAQWGCCAPAGQSGKIVWALCAR